MDNTRLEALKATFTNRSPYCSGTCHVPAPYLTLFYSHGQEEEARRVDLLRASEAQLESLIRSCQPTTFGLEHKEVPDETYYRKVGNLDVGNFASPFDPIRAGIMEHIREELLVGDQQLEQELYKLNVYEKGGFFQPRQETRGERMFGSLVVILPTEHEGGELILRHDNNQWVVGFTEAFKHASEPCVGYVAFFSDIEHEVAPVRSGYRVTLTYNLYFTSPDPNQSISRTLPHVSPQEQSFEMAITELINSSNTLPNGGYLGLGLQYQYPVTPGGDLLVLTRFLKGSDAVIANVCNRLSLSWFIKVFYMVKDESNGKTHSLLMGMTPPEGDRIEEGGLVWHLKRYGAKLINVMSGLSMSQGNDKAPGEWDRPPIDLLVLKDMNAVPSITTRYIKHGNDSDSNHISGHLCLVIALNHVDTRTKLLPQVWD